MTEDEIIYAAWRDSEAYAVPVTKEGGERAEQRWLAFKKGWKYAKFHSEFKHVNMDDYYYERGEDK
jgi:hypothetical protein